MTGASKDCLHSLAIHLQSIESGPCFLTKVEDGIGYNATKEKGIPQEDEVITAWDVQKIHPMQSL